MPDETPVGEATLENSTDAPASEELAPVAPEEPAPAKKTARKTATKKAAVKKTTTKRTATKKVAAAEPPADAADESPESAEQGPAEPADTAAAEPAPAKKTAARKTAAKRTTTRKTAAKKAAAPAPEPADAGEPELPLDETLVEEVPAEEASTEAPAETPAAPPTTLVFQAPATTTTVTRRTRKATTARTRPAAEEPVEAHAAEPAPQEAAEQPVAPEPVEEKPARQGGRGGTRGGRRRPEQGEGDQPEKPATSEDDQEEPAERDESAETDTDTDTDEGEGGGGRRRRRRGGRRRRKSGDGDSGGDDHEADNGSAGGNGGSGRGAGPQESDEADSDQDDSGEGTSRRRRRRRRSGDDNGEGGDDSDNTVTRVRRPRSAEDEITAISGSTRLEAKKQRRRDGREAGRRRAPIVSEAEFLARRESVDRVMVIRQRDELTQIGVLEDKVLVEHYVARESQTSLIGNVYLGRVQNVLPSMEAAFVDIGKGRNAVLYAGEVNWSALGHREGQPRKIESVLSSGQSVLVQVTKDPIGHKGARLTSQISLAGRFLVYVPDGTTSGISRKLPDTERNRLKTLLKELVPDSAGVIVRTAAEGASEDELTRDVERLKARWEDIESKSKGSAPQLLYGEPDLTLKVVRDLFTEDFARLVIEGDDAWDTVQGYVAHVAPDLEERLERYVPADHQGKDIFATYRVEEQIAKGLDRKVWLPSGGSLVIDRTEAMTVVDVNTGKFTGSGGNLEETVTKNNLEAAEEIVRQLRLRDIGGIIVVDFIDMVLESNRDLVLRRLVECLGRDRTRHQVAEVTSLGLVQMTRKRIGTGLVESFSENCTHCQGRGVVIHDAPVEPSSGEDESRRGGGRRTRGGRGRGENEGAGNGSGSGSGNGSGNEPGRGGGTGGGAAKSAPSPKDVAAVAKPENAERSEDSEKPAAEQVPPEAATPEAPAPEAPAAEEAGAAAAPQVVTRTRRRAGGRAQDAPAETTEAPAPAAAAEEAPAAVAPGVPEVEEEVEEQVAATPPAAPQVVTRTRRRAAGRAQEAPAQVAEAPVPAAAEVPTAEEEAPAAVAPGVPEVEEQVEEQVAPTPPAAPQIVTRTRRRAATRPAGPPAGATATTVTAAEVDPDDGSVDGAADGHLAEHVEHVPIKKKGSRKR